MIYCRVHKPWSSKIAHIHIHTSCFCKEKYRALVIVQAYSTLKQTSLLYKFPIEHLSFMILLWCYVLTCRMCLWCYSECIYTPGKLKNLPDHSGNRTRDLWFASRMLCQLSYEVKSVRVCDISELSLVPSISVCFYL